MLEGKQKLNIFSDGFFKMFFLLKKYFCRPRMLVSGLLEDGSLNINCCDPLGRSALLMAIDNENLEMVDLLLENKV